MALLLAGCYARIPLPGGGGGGGTTTGTTSDDPGTETETDTDTDTDDPQPTDKYGTVDNPLTIAQAKALIDEETETKQTMYVAGVVKSNTAWSTTYNDLNIFITDGSSEFELYGCTLPEGFEPAQPAKDDSALIGKLLVGSGTGKKHNNTYELDKGSKVEKFLPAPTATGITITSGSEVTVGSSIALKATVTPVGASQEVEWEVTEGSSYATISEGRLEGKAVGSVTVKATAKGVSSVTATKTIEVKAAPSGTITEELTMESFGITEASTTYANHTYTSDHSIEYSANCASNYSTIQLRKNATVSGVVGGSTAYECVSITFDFNEQTTNANALNLYGSNTELTIAGINADNSPISTITVAGEHSYTFTSSFSYIGIRSSQGAWYINSITIVWKSK